MGSDWREQLGNTKDLEVRTALHSIIGFAQLLLMSTLDDQQHQMVTAIQVNAQRLSVLLLGGKPN